MFYSVYSFFITCAVINWTGFVQMKNVDLLWASASQWRLTNVSVYFSSHRKVFFLWILRLWRNICLPLFFLQFSICAYFLSLTFAICKKNSLAPALFADCLTFCWLSVSTHILAPLLFCFSALFFCLLLILFFFSLATFSFPLLKGKWPLSDPVCLSYTKSVGQRNNLFYSEVEMKKQTYLPEKQRHWVSVCICVCVL